MRRVLPLLLLTALLTAPAAARTVLLVDDDSGWHNDQPFRDGLAWMNREYTLWDVSRQGNPQPADVAAADLVVWVTGGRWSDLSRDDVRLIEQRVKSGRSTLVAGKYTGRDLNWGWLDRWLFGFDYRNTEIFPQDVVPAHGFGPGFRVETDHGLPQGGAEALYMMAPRPGGQQPVAATATRYWAWGARTAWIGFDLRDVFSYYDQRRILQDVLWYVTFSPAEALAELSAPKLDSARKAFLLRTIEEDLLREGPEGGETSRALASAGALPGAVRVLRSRVARAMHAWPKEPVR